MLRSLLVLPSGEEIFSGGPGTAIRSMELSRCVNSGQELTLGSVCAAMLKARLLAPEGLSLGAGEEVRLYQVDSAGGRLDRGLFTVEKPTALGRGQYEITAYDRVARLDRELTDWLAGLEGWPYDLYTFAGMVCQACGLVLGEESLPNGSLPVRAFTAQGITGRQLMRWIGQAAGRFVVADTDGRIRFGWYSPAEGVIGPGGISLSARFREGQLILQGTAGVFSQENLTLSGVTGAWEAGTVSLAGREGWFYYQGSLSREDYQVAPVEAVSIGMTGEDVGAVWPDTPGANTYRITGNPLLSAETAGELEPVARSLQALLSEVSYTPCSLSVPTEADVAPGSVLTVLTPGGEALTVYVMSVTQSGGRVKLSCTGSPCRDTAGAVNELRYEALSGRVLELGADVEGLRAENRAAGGDLAALKLSVEGIRATVTRQEALSGELESRVTTLSQDAKEVALQVQTIRTQGVDKVVTGMGYSFTDEGLRIRDPGEQMENRLNNFGMFVERAGEVILRADSAGVLATDVEVRNYLQVGEHARFEDYESGRTACFWM